MIKIQFPVESTSGGTTSCIVCGADIEKSWIGRVARFVRVSGAKGKFAAPTCLKCRTNCTRCNTLVEWSSTISEDKRSCELKFNGSVGEIKEGLLVCSHTYDCLKEKQQLDQFDLGCSEQIQKLKGKQATMRTFEEKSVRDEKMMAEAKRDMEIYKRTEESDLRMEKINRDIIIEGLNVLTHLYGGGSVSPGFTDQAFEEFDMRESLERKRLKSEIKSHEEDYWQMVNEINKRLESLEKQHSKELDDLKELLASERKIFVESLVGKRVFV